MRDCLAGLEGFNLSMVVAQRFPLIDGPLHAVKFGEVTLDEATEVNIWQDPPLSTFDV